jgi:putative DNA-invertase from lambdoid prophage Rac
LLAQAARRKLDLIVVWKLDRAFRSVAHMATTVEQLRRWGVGLRSYSEPWLDTSGSSPAADLMLNILASFAQFERALIAERVRAGMARAKKQGKHLGRPGGTQAAGFAEGWATLRPRVLAGEISRRTAARMLGIGDSTLRRLLASAAVPEGALVPA